MTKLQRLTRPKLPPVPTGWITREQLAKMEKQKVSSSVFYHRVRKAVEIGVLKRKLHPTIDSLGRVQQTPIYRFTK